MLSGFTYGLIEPSPLVGHGIFDEATLFHDLVTVFLALEGDPQALIVSTRPL